MIKVTVWNEFIHEKSEENVRKVFPDGLHEYIKSFLETEDDIKVRTATLDMEECGLSEEVLEDTDVLIWWGHAAHEKVPDEIAFRVVQSVQKGMGLIVLHSGHMSKPMRYLLGTSCTLKWRDGDREHLWCALPSHPIAKGIPEQIELDPEEMYGEPFDIPTPDEVVFMGWFAGGEVFRSGCTWRRGNGKIFYFQPGHESNPSYKNKYVQQIIKNAVRWAKSDFHVKKLECPNPQPIETK